MFSAGMLKQRRGKYLMDMDHLFAVSAYSCPLFLLHNEHKPELALWSWGRAGNINQVRICFLSYDQQNVGLVQTLAKPLSFQCEVPAVAGNGWEFLLAARSEREEFWSFKLSGRSQKQQDSKLWNLSNIQKQCNFFLIKDICLIFT